MPKGTLSSQRPLPAPFLSNYILAALAFFARDTILSYLLGVAKFKYVWLELYIEIVHSQKLLYFGQWVP
jgi:hypothetical protein